MRLGKYQCLLFCYDVWKLWRIHMCNPLTSSHHVCPSCFAHSVVHMILFHFSGTDTVCLVQTIMVQALILIIVNDQCLMLLSITMLQIWRQCSWTSGWGIVVSRNSHTVGFDAKFCHLFILLLACRSTVALDNPTDAPVAKVRQSS